MAVHSSRTYVVMARDGSRASAGTEFAPADASATAIVRGSDPMSRLWYVAETFNDDLAIAPRRVRRIPLVVDAQIHVLETRSRDAIDEFVLRDDVAILHAGKKRPSRLPRHGMGQLASW